MDTSDMFWAAKWSKVFKKIHVLAVDLQVDIGRMQHCSSSELVNWCRLKIGMKLSEACLPFFFGYLLEKRCINMHSLQFLQHFDALIPLNFAKTSFKLQIVFLGWSKRRYYWFILGVGCCLCSWAAFISRPVDTYASAVATTTFLMDPSWHSGIL